ncbi:MAG: ABC transporter ATP-binding protein, partial [Chloroflexi bacterium]|nr:ABC transporter ATP-binding protein [Chloroflexota bacterium]
TTAYQICDDILVMYKGSVVEQGSVERVIRDPKHPYTRLLVESIPQMRADSGWEEGGDEVLSIDESGETTGCKFADRCPHGMDRCHDEHPTAFQINDDRVASCYLYDEMPIANRAPVAS